MNTPCTIYLVRHGESVANRDHRVTGQYDSPLSAKGREQANAVRAALADVHFDTAYSSDLRRASVTAAIIYGRPVPKGHRWAALRERTFGRLEGQRRSNYEWEALNREFESRYGSLPFVRRQHYKYADFIETDKSLLDRFADALRQIARQHAGQTVLVGSHGGNIRVLLMHLGFAEFLPAGSFKNAGYVALTCDGQNIRLKKVVGVDKSAQRAE